MIRFFNCICKLFLLVLAYPTHVFCNCIEHSGSKKETMLLMSIFGFLAWLGLFFVGFVFFDLFEAVK